MEKNIKSPEKLRYGSIMKPLITEFRNKQRQAAVYETWCLGYEVVFFENNKEVDRKNLILKIEKAEYLAKSWVNEIN
jgi:hypothetical protein